MFMMKIMKIINSYFLNGKFFKSNFKDIIMKLNDLVVLLYAPENYESFLLSAKNAKKIIPELQIDLEKKEWSYKHIKNIPIGKGTYMNLNYSDFEPKGIYNIINAKELISMVNDTIRTAGKVNI